jgi:triphosphoribosyl-dephospho-CoA synthase
VSPVAVGPVSRAAALSRARAAFLCACRLDVAVRKPGNVSLASPGHGMQASQFLASAEAAATPLFESGARVGRRIENAVAASVAAAGCNTNLGIVLLCAPIAVALERAPQPASAPALRQAIEAVLGELDVVDAQAAYRAIAFAHPGGLGRAEREDVHDPPSLGLRGAMALAASRDSIARQYATGYADLFQLALPLCARGFPPTQDEGCISPDALTKARVQRVYLGLLSRMPDSHIVRKHGSAVAQTVMRAAQGWRVQSDAGVALDALATFAHWDEALKRDAINPGTSADLTVATLFVAGVLHRDVGLA